MDINNPPAATRKTTTSIAIKTLDSVLIFLTSFPSSYQARYVPTPGDKGQEGTKAQRDKGMEESIVPFGTVWGGAVYQMVRLRGVPPAVEDEVYLFIHFLPEGFDILLLKGAGLFQKVF